MNTRKHMRIAASRNCGRCVFGLKIFAVQVAAAAYFAGKIFGAPMQAYVSGTRSYKIPKWKSPMIATNHEGCINSALLIFEN